MEKFKESDLVTVTEIIESLEGEKDDSHVLCEVLVVGKDDLFLKTLEEGITSYSTRYFAASKKMCRRISEETPKKFHDVLKPKIGDLVMSFPSKYSHNKRVVGLLEEIKHLSGRFKTAKVRDSSKLHIVIYQDLIVL